MYKRKKCKTYFYVEALSLWEEKTTTGIVGGGV
jgi:hypothetical protein